MNSIVWKGFSVTQYIHKIMYMCIYTLTHVSMYTCVYTHAHVYVYVRVYTDTHARTRGVA